MSKKTETSNFGSGSRISHDSSRYYHSRMSKNLASSEAETEVAPDNVLPRIMRNKIILGSSEKMAGVPGNSVHLMVTSPPYNATKEYDKDLSLEEYLDFLYRVFTETYRVLVNGGRACVNIANLGRKPYIPLSDYISMMMNDIGFLMRGEIIWFKGASAGVSMAWGSWKSASNPVLRDVHEYILIFSKGTFKRRKPKGGEDTIEKEQFMEWTKSIWTMNTASAKRVGHPAPFPVELPYRLIQLYTYKGDVILDPFIGSGSTALAALQSGRDYLGYEIDPDYVDLARKRIQQFVKQENLNA